MALAYGNRGVAYDNKGEFDQAAHDYDESVRLDSSSASSHRMLGNSYKLKKDYDRAIAEYDEAIRLDPNDALPYGNRGTVYYAKKEYDRAIAEFSEGIRLDPTFTVGFYDRGLAYLAKHDSAHAIADFDEAIRVNPKFALALADRGRAYAEKKEYDRAIADYTEALDTEPIERVAAPAISGRCWARFIVGRDLQDTVADCTKALNFKPNVAWILNNARALTYLKLGEFDRSIADFDAALADKSNPAVAHYGDMAVSYYGRGLAKHRVGKRQAGDTDMWVAQSFRPDVASVVAQYGVK